MPLTASRFDEVANLKAEIEKLQASQAEIKALSFNYATMLTEREEQLSKLREEYINLKKFLEPRSTSSEGGSTEQPSTRTEFPYQESSHVVRNHMTNADVTEQNRCCPHTEGDGVYKKGSSFKSQKEALSALKENNKELLAANSNLESKVKQLTEQLKNEHDKAALTMQKLNGIGRTILNSELQLNLDTDESRKSSSFQRDLNKLTSEKEKASSDLKELQKVMERTHELQQLQDQKNSSATGNCALGNSLQTENAELKVEEEMIATLSIMERKLEDSYRERDKALQELTRLKQHLLDKEIEDSEKMNEDGKTINDLRESCEHQRAHILQLDRALKQEMAKKDENMKLANDELEKSTELIKELRQQLANCMSTLESKNMELLNLQTALGQLYAEIDAKERLGNDLVLTRRELVKLLEHLKVAKQELEMSRRDSMETAAKLLQAEKLLADSKCSIQKLEEDNSRLRHALELHMTALNRMSLDSDNSVDRRIVIKLLITYFQRNHSKEVLDLMVRMLGFSEEDKQRIGAAHKSSDKGVVRSVLGLPGRLAGGILTGHSADMSQSQFDNQSFADLWIDFLLKESEEREKRGSSEAAPNNSPTVRSAPFPTSVL